MEIMDDRQNNIITLVESYRLPTQKFSNKRVMKIFSYTLRDYLEDRINPERAAPYEISYPLWVKERIHIDNSFKDWEEFEEDYKKEHESLSYTQSTRIEKNRAIFNLELKHLQDHIPQASLRNYWTLVNDINREAPYKMTIASQSSTKNIEFSLAFSITGLAMLPLLYFISRKKRPTQDLLSFQLGKFQKFYTAITVLCISCISSSLTNTLFISFVISIFTTTVCHNIFLQRSVKISWILQGFLALLACFMFYLVFSPSGIQLFERILASIVCCTYLGSCLFILKNVGCLLHEEKTAASC